MQYAIEIQNIEKTFKSIKRKLWFSKFTHREDTETNVRIAIKKNRLFNTKIKETKALSNINLNVPKGEILGLLGPNGAGKTTLAKIVSTLVLPDKGSVTLNGYNVETETVLSRFSLGLVTGGERSLYWKLTPLQNLRFFGGLYGMTRSESYQRAMEFLKIFGLLNKKDELVQNLSTGEKMKVAMIRSLMHDPEVLILDEYNRGLDPKASKQLRNYIKQELQKKQGKTILVMTHSMDVAEDLCNTITLIDRGKIVAKGSPATLMANLSQNRIIEMEFQEQLNSDVIHQLEQFGEVEISNGSVCNVRLVVEKNPNITFNVLQVLRQNKIELENLNLKNPSLEDVFIKYTGRKLGDDDN